MTKTKPKRRKRTFPPATAPTKAVAAKPASSEKRPIRWGLIALFLTISIGGTYLAVWLRRHEVAPRYTYELVAKFPHDESAFTQGILIDDGYLWESTGRYGESSVRKIELETGRILKSHSLDESFFGEGLAMHDGQLFQLTWKSGKAFVYDRDLNPKGEFNYQGQGWGLTTDGNDLILSDGSQHLQFIDPKTFKVRRSIRVLRKGGMPVGQLNELEYAGGKVYANCYQTDIVYEIEPKQGDVTGIIDLSGLWPTRDRPTDGILNGIAVIPSYPPRMFVTGKLCPWIYEIKLVRESDR